jgi:hypothetical protein
MAYLAAVGYQCRLMDSDQLREIAEHHGYGSLGLDPDPEIAFIGVRALQELADFCESYQVNRLREAGNSWAQIASWAGLSPQALHKKHGHTRTDIQEPPYDGSAPPVGPAGPEDDGCEELTGHVDAPNSSVAGGMERRT